jgi:ATP-dependent 26S proteasome regulatory subunit
VQQTIVELLNQLDGVGSYESIKVIAATNRPEVLDPAFLRSGRLDQKIEFPHPSEQARVRILEASYLEHLFFPFFTCLVVEKISSFAHIT